MHAFIHSLMFVVHLLWGAGFFLREFTPGSRQKLEQRVSQWGKLEARWEHRHRTSQEEGHIQGLWVPAGQRGVRGALVQLSPSLSGHHICPKA